MSSVMFGVSKEDREVLYASPEVVVYIDPNTNKPVVFVRRDMSAAEEAKAVRLAIKTLATEKARGGNNGSNGEGSNGSVQGRRKNTRGKV